MNIVVVVGLVAASANPAGPMPAVPVPGKGSAPISAAPIDHRWPVRPHKAAGRRPALSLTALRIVAGNRAATLEAGTASSVGAIQVYPFSDGNVVHVFTAPGQVTDIALQAGEVLGAVAAGDTVRWVIGDTASGSGETKRTHVLVKPWAAGLSTNLVITTDRRTYHLALSSGDRAATVAVAWTYPQDQLIALKAAADQARAAQPVASGLSLERLNFDYLISGDRPAWRPLRAFDDGRQTFIEFPASLATGEAPPLFLVDGKGATQLVNYRVQGRFYVVDRLFEAAELRLGLKRQEVVRISRGGASEGQGRAS